MAECIFCKIVNGEIKSEFLYEDEEVVAFYDVNPQAPVHCLIIPRTHCRSIKEVSDENLVGKLFIVGNEVAKKLGLNNFRYVINTGEEAGQSVFHLHLHLLGGRVMNWPPG